MNLMETNSKTAQEEDYDLIVIGSGNGACGFLSEVLKNARKDLKVLVLEEGRNFFYTGNITHQDNWSKSYATSNIFKLHNTATEDNRAIISGRANTMGGGGSINFTMMHESSSWLKDKMGHTEEYWDTLKDELNEKFHRPDPLNSDGYNPQTKFSYFIEEQAGEVSKYEKAGSADMIKNIPSLSEDRKAKKIYRFPAQFNAFGQRTNSGVSIVDWSKITLLCEKIVTKLEVASGSCSGVFVKDVSSNRAEKYNLAQGGRVVLACGSQTPLVLMETDGIENSHIGKRVNDHICLPLAIYCVTEKEQFEAVSPKNAYESLFATFFVQKSDDKSSDALVCIDFFTGDLLRLLYLVSSLYLCYLPFNTLKRIMGRYPYLFNVLSNSVRVFLTMLIVIIYVPRGILNLLKCKPFGKPMYRITTALIKFNATTEGYYTGENDNKIVLNFFKDKADIDVATKAIKDSVPFLESLGEKPPLVFRILFSLLTKIPYSSRKVERYVSNFAKNTLLSEQHLAGGCIFGTVLDKGTKDPSNTGKVIGTENVFVADLSAVPLPRVSTQMTAYLVGYHVGKHFYPKSKKH